LWRRAGITEMWEKCLSFSRNLGILYGKRRGNWLIAPTIRLIFGAESLVSDAEIVTFRRKSSNIRFAELAPFS
ncbi:MAG TPA: hypothetical protein VGZ47_03020, partial [Gemmataceae bacterium]|nr:hypothetical protein [Gemmataceae bacterium]